MKPTNKISVNDFMNCLYKDDYPKIKEMLFNGVDVNAQYNQNGWTPFMWACKEYYESEMIQLFLDAGGDVHSRNKGGQTPFKSILRLNSTLFVKYFVF